MVRNKPPEIQREKKSHQTADNNNESVNKISNLPRSGSHSRVNDEARSGLLSSIKALSNDSIQKMDGEQFYLMARRIIQDQENQDEHKHQTSEKNAGDNGQHVMPQQHHHKNHHSRRLHANNNVGSSSLQNNHLGSNDPNKLAERDNLLHKNQSKLQVNIFFLIEQIKKIFLVILLKKIKD